MPELPEVETVRRTLVPHLVGRAFRAVQVRDTRLRLPVSVGKLERLVICQTVLGIRRRAKYLLIDLTNDHVLLLHLGMSGKLILCGEKEPLAKHDHVVWMLSDGRQLRFNDARRFGLVECLTRSEENAHPQLKKLGVEPLSEEFSSDQLFEMTRRSNKPIKNFLMDSHQIVGIGNIYACEALHLAQLNPFRAAKKLNRENCAMLTRAIKNTLNDAIEQGGTTLRDFVDVDGTAGYFAIRLQIYGREGVACLRCKSRVHRKVQAGRSTFYCSKCQK